MKENNNLFDIAVNDYKCAKKLYETAFKETDESYLNNAAYLLQQSVDKSIKFVLENNGLEIIKTHNIESLITYAKEKGFDLHLNKYIIDHSEMFSMWEASSRYVSNYKVEADKISEALINVELYLKNIEKNEFELNDNNK